MNTTSNLLMQSLFFDLFTQLIPIIIIGFVMYILLNKIAKRFEKKADERIAFERENNERINQRLDELNQRLVVIEKMLKEVE